MPVDRPFHAEPLRILAVAESDAAAAAIVTALGDEFAGSVRLSVEPSIADASPAGTEVVLLALDSLVACERRARALQAEAGAEAPLLIAVCRTAELAAAARLARTGVVDDYVLHPLESGSPRRMYRLARSARLRRNRVRRAPGLRSRGPRRA